jgi:superfamily II DNA or RNA helicase/HKD family nuclease/diadenosine tetraphosphate (Ap4A) HIT family hydrolase
MTERTILSTCPFCDPAPDRVFLRLGSVIALWDGFPVTPGHALIVPTRHVATWADANESERSALWSAIDPVCAAIGTFGPADAFNFGINSGPAAGQTVPHLHLHVIPRRHGDMPDPRGGVRHVIPSRGNYLAANTTAPVAADVGVRPESALRLTTADDRARHRDATPHAVLTTGDSIPLLPELERDLARASRVDIAVAFVMPSGVDRLLPHFEDLLGRGGRLRLLTGDYLGITDPDALQRLLDLATLHEPEQVALRVFVTDGRSFHPKAYLLTRGPDDGVAYVGSSNLSSSALTEGVEWNYRVASSRDAAGLRHVGTAFEALFAHPSTRPLDEAWIADYRGRRPRLAPPTPTAGEADTVAEPPAPIPEPNPVQQEALRALEATRAAGNRAGLVVMATGLGKTWLAAFDIARPEFRRVLFVAHREEILGQALATFRRVRPDARLGLYNGAERTPDAEILFASIQTLSRREHLGRFARDAFDYVVVDEFHHAAAATYRRLIDHFDPAFLLGLTATPERTDGGDLLALCGENLVYRCAVPRGIELGLLCPYAYFGVPDDVDYANIPWRSTRFDDLALTEAVATTRRADNVLEQWRKHRPERTLAFCVSQRHADFMREHFAANGVACASVHSGPGSDGRALSLERLAAGELQVVFAVDMFNEGVDVPSIDAVMMLRPTESQIVWLQQFGRGLRKHGDKRLTVIDYIGNHRSFLVKVKSLLAIEPGGGDRALMNALQAAQAHALELPPGCEVTYELEALDILRALLRVPTGQADALRAYYVDFKERHGQRPTASEAFHDGYLPRNARVGYGSWLGLVRAEGDLDPDERAAFDACNAFLAGLETTRMTRSYKMLVVLAMLNTDTLPGPAGIELDALRDELSRLASRTDTLRADVGAALDDPAALKTLIRSEPIRAWTGEGAIPGVVSFAFEVQRLRFTLPVPEGSREAFQRLVRELVDWRLAEYLSNAKSEPTVDRFTMKVSHAGGRPILFLPDRATTPGIPEGWTEVRIDGRPHRANFVKVAVNVVQPEGVDENVLPKILRAWFGHDAGQPGTNHRVECERTDEGWTLAPLGARRDDVPEPFRRYTREQIPRLFGQAFSQAIWNAGFIVVTPDAPKHLCLLVTLHKGDMDEQFQYGDRFLSNERFQWQSQNRTRQSDKHGNLIRNHERLGVAVHLFVRAEKRLNGGAAPFVYCGPVTFLSWSGEQPITVTWKLDRPLPDRLLTEWTARRST